MRTKTCMRRLLALLMVAVCTSTVSPRITYATGNESFEGGRFDEEELLEGEQSSSSGGESTSNNQANNTSGEVNGRGSGSQQGVNQIAVWNNQNIEGDNNQQADGNEMNTDATNSSEKEKSSGNSTSNGKQQNSSNQGNSNSINSNKSSSSKGKDKQSTNNEDFEQGKVDTNKKKSDKDNFGNTTDGESNSIQGNSQNGEWPKAPTIDAKSMVLMEANNNVILANKKMEDRIHPTSITKLMTALLLVEKMSPTDQITFTSEGVKMVSEESGNLDTKLGELFTVDQCLNALLFDAANDVAVQVATQIAGSEEKFVELMNTRAKELGCVNTNFVNCTGLPTEEHWSTTGDLALISAAAFSNDIILGAANNKEYTIPATNKTNKPRKLKNTHPLLENYEGFIGGKFAHTYATGSVMVSVAERNGMEIVCVVTQGTQEKVKEDATKLLDFSFENFQLIPLLTRLTDIKGSDGTVPKGITIDQLEKLELPDEAMNTMILRYYFNDVAVGKIDLTIEQWKQENGQESIAPTIVEEEETTTPAKPVESKQMKKLKNYIIIGMLLLVGLEIVLIVILIVENHKNKKRKQLNKKRKKSDPVGELQE